MYSSRPSGITLVAAWFIVIGLVTVFTGAGAAFQIAQIAGYLGLEGSGVAPLSTVFMLVGVVLLATGVGLIVCGWGLLEARPWARTWGVVLAGVSAVAGLVLAIAPGLAGSFVAPALIVLGGPAVLNLLAAAYLLSAESTAYFSGSAAPGPWMIQPTIQQPLIEESGSLAHPMPPLAATQLVQPAQASSAWLVLRRANHSLKSFPVSYGRSVIGRDGSRCQIVVDDATISAEHAAIVFEHGRYVLYDLASTNGTYVNDHRTQRQMLYDGDRVRLGTAELIFKRV
jgi:hypothetical protein